MYRYSLVGILAVAVMSMLTISAKAALVSFQTFTGNVAASTDGWGGLDGVGTISASVPAGSTVVAAYIYSATFDPALRDPPNPGQTTPPSAVTLNGMVVNYDVSNPNDTSCCSLSSHRADVTSIVSAAVGTGGGVFNFDIAENADNDRTDGHALVVVYSNPTLPEATVGILDGFADVTGDTTSINFADPLAPSDPDFFAEMVLGINFSCCSQRSNVDVNGMLLTENAGNFDDGEDLGNGSLITVGSFDDPFSPSNPTYADDTERYDLSSFVTAGDTSIVIDTFNSSQDDNIFLASFYVSGIAGINEPPPTNVVPVPGAIWLFGVGLSGLGVFSRRRRRLAR